MEEMPDSGLSPQYQSYERQKCFIGYSRGARWRADIESVFQEVLQGVFGLEPWYADEHPDPTKVLRDKVVEMIANTRYGIYDISYWRKDEKSEWVMPRNVLIELGMAVALNRPMLLLRHVENEEAGLRLPVCLESASGHILEFSGKTTLKRVLKERLPQWISIPPDRGWWNRYCVFGSRTCEYREAYPRATQWGQETLCCHVADGQDKDRLDFRGVVEEVLGSYDNLAFEYLDALSIADGYDFLFCTLCQGVRSMPFAIYRITPKTPAETFIAIGISIALEKQFKYEIPKILLTAEMQDVPSLLYGYEVVEAKNDTERKVRLQKFVPVVMQKVRKTTWRPRPLPFIEVVPRYAGKLSAPIDEQASRIEEVDLSVEGNIEHIPYGSCICQLYTNVTEIPGVTARLICVGLSLSEKCMFAAAPAQVKELCEELRKLEVDVDAVILTGQLVLHEEREIFLAKGNRFDPYFLVSSHQTFLTQSLREGWQAMRFSIDMSWLTQNVATPEQLLKYEATCNAVFVFQNAPIVALMHYDHSKLLPSLSVEILKLHPLAIVGKFIKRNPSYLDSEQYMLKMLRLKENKGEEVGP